MALAGQHKFIYGNIRVLWRTERLLAQAETLEFPAAYRAWIEPVYQKEDWDDEPEAVSFDYDKARAEGNASEVAAQQIIAMQRKAYGDHDENFSVQTRDGEMSLPVLPVLADGRLLDGSSLDALDDGQWAETLNLNTILVSHTWRKFALADCSTDEEGRYHLAFATDSDGTWIACLNKVNFRYSKEFGLERNTDSVQPSVP